MSQFITTFLTIAGLHFLGLISPGPDFILVTKNALLYRRVIAVWTAAGIAAGISIHVSYCVLGLAIVLMKSAAAAMIVKCLGGSYLIYIGSKACLNRSKSLSSSDAASASIPFGSQGAGKALMGEGEGYMPISPMRAFGQGFLCNVLNPKAGLFILGLFTLAIKPSVPLWTQWIYGSWIIISTFFWFAIISIIITHQSVRQRLLRIQPLITRLMGIFLIIFGLELILWWRH